MPIFLLSYRIPYILVILVSMSTSLTPSEYLVSILHHIHIELLLRIHQNNLIVFVTTSKHYVGKQFLVVVKI